MLDRNKTLPGSLIVYDGPEDLGGGVVAFVLWVRGFSNMEADVTICYAFKTYTLRIHTHCGLFSSAGDWENV
jgi:hypothetical protein